ncbi:MAG: M14 family zinc carboxypeptidase, partial [Prolixibacteraceae bacterium]|nr:M14 family zinc carboxypeptidase [Prolixibacteraceae bacterium]
MGTDYKLARWDKITEYFYLIEKQSDKLKVMNLGPSSEGHPFLVLLISSPENIANLDRLQYINKKINDPENLSADSLSQYIEEGKAVVFQSMSLHASEVGATQMSTELTWDLLTRKDEDCTRILDNVLFFMIPCFNPDGQVMITDWYNETYGTKYEGMGMPYLYHKYCGHDNNRDGDYFNLQESGYTAEIMYIDWQPQAYVDHHHMGSYGARFYVPPYCDPIRPHADPLIWRETSWYGAHIAYKLEEEGFNGVLNAAQFSGWGHFGWHWITLFHNIAGMLTESATVNYASPVFIHPEQLT